MADLNKLRHRFGIASLLLATAIVVVAFTVPARAEQIRYYDSQNNVVGTVGSLDEFLDTAIKRGSRISFLSPKRAAENFAETVIHETNNPAASFAPIAFGGEDCGLPLHPMLNEALDYFRKQQPVQLAYELEKIRIKAFYHRGSFCNVARAGIENITHTFDNLLFWRNEPQR